MSLDQALISERGAIAEAVVARLYAERPGLAERYGPSGRAKCVQDMTYTVHHIADAIWADQPGLLSDYLSWAKATMEAYSVDAADIQRSLELLLEVIPGHVAGDSAERARDSLAEAMKRLASIPSCADCGVDPLDPLARRYLDALLAGDRDSASRMVVNEFLHGRSLRDLYLDVLVPVQREVGRLWQTRQITVAREHFCTSSIRQLMGRLAVDAIYEAKPRTGPLVLAAAVSGEEHELGVRALSDLFEAEGHRVFCCGANTPTAGLAAEVARQRPAVLALSATMTFHLRRVAEVIQAVRAVPGGRSLPILVGGLAFDLGDALCTKVGGDSRPADLAAALAAVRDAARI